MPPTDKQADKRRGQMKHAKQPKQPAYDVTVKDCLIWPSGEKNSANAATSDSVYVSLRSQKQNKGDRGSSEQQLQQLGGGGGGDKVTRRDDGTVIDALRGWPRHQQQSDQQDEDQFPYPPSADDNAPAQETKKPVKSSKPSAGTKAKTGKSNKRVVVKEPENVHVSDLISQRYLHEYVDQRQAQQEKERIKKEATARAASQGRRAAKGHCDIKANKAAQLRAIALADRVETSPADLWKMDKFTKNARPHLSTFRTRTASGGAGAGAGSGNRSRITHGSADDTDEFHYGPCTCPEQESYYYGEMDYNNDDDCDYQLPSMTAAVAL